LIKNKVAEDINFNITKDNMRICNTNRMIGVCGNLDLARRMVMILLGFI